MIQDEHQKKFSQTFSYFLLTVASHELMI